MQSTVVNIFGVLSLLASALFYVSTLDIVTNLSPQGCRMSWMSPSYLRQPDFNGSWTPLAQRYSLWLYREVGWDASEIDRESSVPVLFIPGNAGSSHQVRSIASSATRQFHSAPYVVSPEFSSRRLKSLDFYAVEFNEDLSAFHGPTLESQIAYTSAAVSYIHSLYPENTPLIVLGHSMGGIVATSLLPSPNISAVITMSTPYTLPPARFDSRIDDIYRAVQEKLRNDDTPIVSLCGGATDMLIPSESCILPTPVDDVFRRTVFTSALEGAWTGVGHREMVWCHQVRWRVARAVLELGTDKTLVGRAVTLDKWLRDGHTIPPEITANPPAFFTEASAMEYLPEGERLIIKNPRGSKTYLLPIQTPKDTKTDNALRVTILVSQGSIPPISPYNPLPLRVHVLSCSLPIDEAQYPHCSSLKPSILKLIPNPILGKPFPVPDEGSDESEGVVLFEAEIQRFDEKLDFVAVRIEDADGRGWVVGELTKQKVVRHDVGFLSSFFGGVLINLPEQETLHIDVALPNLLVNALVVYRIKPVKSGYSECSHPLLYPLVTYTSHSVETHYFPLFDIPDHRILLHTHIPAPYISQSHNRSLGLTFSIYSSGETECSRIPALHIQLDVSATLGRWASRYLNTLLCWAAGVAALVSFCGWGESDSRGLSMPTVNQSILIYLRLMYRRLLLPAFILSFIPLPENLYLGTKGEPLFAPLAPLLIIIASGLVCVSWWILNILMWIVGLSSRLLFGRRREKGSIHRGTLASMVMIFFLIFLFVPWQVAYLGCWLLQLHTCASSALVHREPNTMQDIPFVPSTNLDNDGEMTPSQQHHIKQRLVGSSIRDDNLYHSMHMLLLMTWLLPLVAPVLAVWVRTLTTAGFTTPFDGDHVFLNVAPFLVLVDFSSWTSGAIFERQSFEKLISVRWSFAVMAGVAFFFGPRQPYRVFDAAKLVVSLIVIIRVGRRYWGGASWSN